MATGTINFPVLTDAGTWLSPQLSAYSSPPFVATGVWNAAWKQQGSGISVPTASVSGSAFSGVWWPLYERVWWNAVHIVPNRFNLGFVLTAITRTFEVFNNYRVAKVLQSIALNPGTSGITIDTGPTPPAHFPTTQSFNYALHIPANGSPSINEAILFNFVGVTSTLTVTGSRITAWIITPDWSAGVRERLEFKTDVMVAWSGAEQRRALRLSPRRLFEFDVVVGRRERRYMEASLFEWSAQVWGLPIWPDGQLLTSAVGAGATVINCDTVNRDFSVGGLAILIGPDAVSFEVLQTTSVAAGSLTLTQATISAWPAGTRLYPVRAARLSSYPRITRESGNYATLRPAFQTVEPCDWAPATGLPQYRGINVLENSPDSGTKPAASYERQALIVDPGTGTMSALDTAQAGFPAWTHSWWAQGRPARSALRALLYLLRGRQGELWVPSYQNDLKLAANAASSATQIDVEYCGYTNFLSGKLNRRDIRIELSNGTILYRRITAALVVDANTERLTIDSSPGVALDTTQVRRISYMMLARLNADSIEIDHHTAADGLATAELPFRGVKHDV